MHVSGLPQVENELPNTTASTVNWYGGVLRSRLESNLLGPNRPHGVFLDSCYHHCGDVYNCGYNAGDALRVDVPISVLS